MIPVLVLCLVHSKAASTRLARDSAIVAVPRGGWLYALSAIRERPLGGRSSPVGLAYTRCAGLIPLSTHPRDRMLLQTAKGARA